MRKVGLLVLVLFVFVFENFSQAPIKVICSDSVKNVLDEVRDLYKANKEYPEDLELQLLAALSYYPELMETKIKVRYRNIKTTMQCRPTFFSLFRSKDKRDYRIYVDNRKKGNEGVLFEELSFNAQVGIFGHELAHVIDYETKSNFDLIVFGFNYLNYSKRREIEYGIDMLAINRGLGYQLNDFATYVFEESSASEKYLDFKRKIYVKPAQMRRIIAHMPLYY